MHSNLHNLEQNYFDVDGYARESLGIQKQLEDFKLKNLTYLWNEYCDIYSDLFDYLSRPMMIRSDCAGIGKEQNNVRNTILLRLDEPLIVDKFERLQVINNLMSV